MTYVVARPKGRFEIRESVHTAKGPRARTLANFSHLSDEVVERARRRASRPFAVEAVRAAAERAGVEWGTAAKGTAAKGTTAEGTAAEGTARHERPETRHFVDASGRMARSLERVRPPVDRRDPGDALIGLLGFVARVKTFGPARAPEPLRFPPLARLRAERIARADPR